jgi:hypothetical protein
VAGLVDPAVASSSSTLVPITNSDHLKRAAAAIREVRSNDCITQARAALEAAIRSEPDLLALLPPEPCAKSRLQRAVAMSDLPRGADIAGVAG